MNMKDAAARNSDPETAHEAAESVYASGLEKQVLEYLQEHGPSTTHEIADGTGLSLVAVSPRMRPLTRKGLVQDSGRRRANGGSRKSIVWEMRA